MRTSAPASRRSSTTALSASRTYEPEYAPASAVNTAASSIGQNTATPLSRATRMSSSPLAGERWTRPLPALESTNRSATTVWNAAPPLPDASPRRAGTFSYSGCSYRRPSSSEPPTEPASSYSATPASSSSASMREAPTIHTSSEPPPAAAAGTLTRRYSSSGCTPTIASVTSVNGIVVHTTRYSGSAPASPPASLTL